MCLMVAISSLTKNVFHASRVFDARIAFNYAEYVTNIIASSVVREELLRAFISGNTIAQSRFCQLGFGLIKH